MTQDKTMFDSAKWKTEPQIITINYNFSEKRVNDYFRALARLLKKLHDDLALCRFGGSMPKDSKFKAQITAIKEQTPCICERIYNEDKELMVETYDKIRRMKNNVLDILNDAPNYLICKGGSLNQSLDNIEQNSKVYAEITPKSPLNTHSIIKTIDYVFNLLDAKVNELDKGRYETIAPKTKTTAAKKFHKLDREKLEGVLNFAKYRSFEQALFADLELISNSSLYDIAIVAMLIYEAPSNKNIIKARPKTFSVWCKIFAEGLGIDKPISYNQAKLIEKHSLNIKELEGRFYYLK
ncbi:MAG: hypothetical protein SNI70_09105 [Rikenellaceae bacterium]